MAVLKQSGDGRLRRRGVIAACALVLLGAACGGDDGGAAPTATPTPTSTTSSTTSTTTAATTTTLDPQAALEAEILDAYDHAIEVFIDVAAEPNPDDPRLAATHVGPMLENRQLDMAALRDAGQAVRYADDTIYNVELIDGTMQVDGDIATFELCGTDDGQTVVVATGQIVAGGVGTTQMRVAMQRVDGTWRLAERVFDQQWAGVTGCAS